MDEKAKTVRAGILVNALNEPRHFFFWLALVSPLVFVLVLVIAGMTPGGVPPFVHWLALAAIVGFLIALPAFVLSWIPPIRRLFTRLLQHKLLALVCLVTLFALFYAVENWRGRSAWNAFRREWEAQGVEFELDKIVPPPIPESDNMYEAEPWRGFHFIKSATGVTYANSNVTSEIWFDCEGPNRREAPEGTDVFLARQVDLKEWQEFYRGTNNQFASSDGAITNYFPIAATPQTPAKDVLLALSKYDDRLNQIRTAAQRPGARFWINFEDGIGTLLPHLAKFKSISQYLRLRATALLAEGQTEAAFQDVMLGLRLQKALRDEPILISHLVHIGTLHLNLCAVWEGLADHRWSDTQLAAIEAELAKIDVLSEYHTSMGGERYFSIWCVDFIHRTSDVASLSGAPAPGDSSLGEQVMGATGKVLLRMVPRGWFDQNKLSLARMHVNYIRPMVDAEKQLVLPTNSRRAGDALEHLRPTPYDLFSQMLLPALERTARKSAIAQTYVNLARVACALERYRLANSAYPEGLDALTPKFITNLPHDVINGQPLKYRRNADGAFVLYSVGWNEIDDGGQVVRMVGKNGKEGAVDQDKGDWVWRYPAK